MKHLYHTYLVSLLSIVIFLTIGTVSGYGSVHISFRSVLARLAPIEFRTAHTSMPELSMSLVSFQQNRTRAMGDTTRRDNRIIKAYITNAEILHIDIEITEDQPSLEISMYNLLGKKVKDFPRQSEDAGKHSFDFPVGDLPSSMYIVNVQGSTFRSNEKVIISRQ